MNLIQEIQRVFARMIPRNKICAGHEYFKFKIFSTKSNWPRILKFRIFKLGSKFKQKMENFRPN